MFAALVLILAIFSVWPLFSPGWFSMHDFQSVARLFELDKTFRFGVFPVRWTDDLGFGYGYPLFNFYPPLVYYLGEIFHLAGFGFINSTKIVWGVALVGSALAMYFLARKLWGRAGGAVSALFYLYAPYHAVDAYVRGALAELFSFVWLPLILLFSYQTVKEQKIKWALWTGLILGLLMMTHNLIFLPFVGLFIIWYLMNTIILYSIVVKEQRKTFLELSIFYFLFSIFVAFGLTAFFWLPALMEKKYTLVDNLLLKNLASYKLHFVCWEQLWDSPWGFGGSEANCKLGLSLKIGKLHLLASLTAVFLAVILFLKKKVNRSVVYSLLSFVFLFLLSVFMTTKYSQLIWDTVQPLQYLQFPWRFLEFAVLFASLLAGGLVFLIKDRWLKIILTVVLAAAVIGVNQKYFQPQQYLFGATDASLTADKEIKWRVSNSSFEYLPKGFTYPIEETKIAGSQYQIISGDFVAQQESFRPGKILVLGKATKESVIQIQTVNFPGWRAWVDGKPTEISDQNPLKLMTVTVPAGIHTVQLQFTDTMVRQWGNLISAAFILALPGALFYASRRN